MYCPELPRVKFWRECASITSVLPHCIPSSPSHHHPSFSCIEWKLFFTAFTELNFKHNCLYPGKKNEESVSTIYVNTVFAVYTQNYLLVCVYLCSKRFLLIIIYNVHTVVPVYDFLLFHSSKWIRGNQL